MSKVSLILGNFTFGNFEVPAKISFGGTQKLAIHELIGGGRVVNALGDEPKKISFSGVFSGVDARERASALDAVRASGLVLSLGWDGFFYNVIIETINIGYEKTWWLPFEIEVVVVDDAIMQTVNDIVPLATLVSMDAGIAAAYASQAGLSASDFMPDMLSIGKTAIASDLAVLGSGVLGTGNVVSDATDSHSGSAAVTQLLQNCAALAACGAMNGYVGRAMRNLGSRQS